MNSLQKEGDCALIDIPKGSSSRPLSQRTPVSRQYVAHCTCDAVSGSQGIATDAEQDLRFPPARVGIEACLLAPKDHPDTCISMPAVAVFLTAMECFYGIFICPLVVGPAGDHFD
nr:hypothetical protein [uncultured Albidiferax sp.]